MAYTGKNKSIKARLHQVTLMTILIFIVIATSLYFAAQHAWISADRIVEDRLQQTIENSQNSRDFGQLYSRINVFRNTFFGNDALLKSEGREIQEDLKKLQLNVRDQQLKKLLELLSEQMKSYLHRGVWINTLLSWRSDQDVDLEDLLLVLQELITERIVDVALLGGDVSHYYQLVRLISGYRESLLEIAKLNAEEDRTAVLAAENNALPPLSAELDNLMLRLQTLTASEPSIARFGHHLLSRVSYYKYLMQHYQLEMIQLNQQNIALGVLTRQVLDSMERQDKRMASLSLQARNELEETINAMIASILGLLTFLTILSWRGHHRVFKEHIQSPMDLIRRRLTDFQNGDHVTPLDLGRRDEWGEIEEIFNRTISARQQSMIALQESETRYREIFTNTTEGIFRTTLAGQFIELNPAAVSMLGCHSAEEVKAHYTDLGQQLFHDPEKRKEMLREIQFESASLNFETAMKRKDGGIFWCAINNYLVRDDDGNALYIDGTIKDITARRAAQESLKEMKVYLQHIIDSMPSVLIGLDNEMRVILWNKKAEEESIISAVAARGKLMSQVCQLFEAGCYLPQLLETLTTHQPSRLRKIESLKKAADGSSRFFDILVYPLSSANNSGVVIHIDDVTERARFEERMVRSEKMQSVGSLASGLAHEINNPLAAILQNVQVLSRRLSPELRQNKEAAEELGTSIEVIAQYIKLRGCEKMLQSITDAGQRTAKIVANVQSFSRTDAVSFMVCSVSDLIERTLDLASSDYDMRHHYNFQNIQIVRDFHTIPNISCEMSQIQQVLLSLFKNAAQAMSHHSESPCLIVRLKQAGEEHICIQVEDNGPGMDADLCSRIFDPFYTTKDVGSGSGLGLSITYFIVTQTHNGSLSVTSDVGRGSRFDIMLPVTQVAEGGSKLNS